MSDFRARFLTRQDCHLCDEARPVVMRAARKAGVGVDEVDIDSKDELIALYGLRIPVVLGRSGVVLAEGRIDDWRALTRAMRAGADA